MYHHKANGLNLLAILILGWLQNEYPVIISYRIYVTPKNSVRD